MTRRYGGRKRTAFKGRRVMRAYGGRRRVKRGTFRKEHMSRISVDLTSATAILHATTPAGAIHITNCDQGDNDFNRTGNSIVCTKLKARFFFNWHASETIQLVAGIRCMITYHPNKLNVGTFPLLSDILENTGLAVISQFKRKRDVEGNEEFKVVYDKTFYLHKYPTQVGSALWSHGANHRELRISLKPKTRVTYHGATGSDLGRGCYFLWFFTSVAMANDPQVTGTLRFWWKDV